MHLHHINEGEKNAEKDKFLEQKGFSWVNLHFTLTFLVNNLMSGKPVEEMMKNDPKYGSYSAENLKAISSNVKQFWVPYLKLVSE
jgi:hypothetical protein